MSFEVIVDFPQKKKNSICSYRKVCQYSRRVATFKAPPRYP